MAKLKNVLLMALSFALVAALAIGGTVAYLTDTDSTVNVMTVGNVKIEQQEWQRAEGVSHINAGAKKGDLVPFVQGQSILPAVPQNNAATDYSAEQTDLFMWGDYANGGNGLWNDDKLSNVIDKIVMVKNTGKSDAYYRTIIAIESPEGITIGEPTQGAEIMINVNGNSRFDWEDAGYITVNNVRYELLVAQYNEILEPNEVSRPSLLQVVLTHNATNEDMELLGNTLDILVLSQAVQSAGFDDAKTALDTAFGKVSDKAAEWFGGMKAPALVSTADELKDALEAGGEVVLTDDVTVTSTLNVAAGKDVTINLNGNNLSYAVSNTGASAIISNKGNLEITGSGTLSFVAENPDMQAIPSYATNTITNTGTGTLIIGKGVVVTNGSDGGASYAVDVQSGKFILDGGTLVGERCALRIARFNADAEFIMNDGLVKAATPAWIHLPGNNANDAPKISVVINGGTFQSTKTTSEDNDVLYTYSFGNSHANTSVTINGGEFLGGTVSIGSGYKGDVPSLTINGGTFEYDVLQWLENDASKVLYAANK